MAISTHLDASRGRTSIFPTAGPRLNSILSIFRVTAFGTRINGYIHHIVHDIATNIVLDIVPDFSTNIVYNIVYDIVRKIVPVITLFMTLLAHDCVCVVTSYLFRIEPLENIDPIGYFDVTGGVMFGMRGPFLFFTCTLCPTGCMAHTTSHKDVSLVFFNTFETISLTPASCMQRKGVPMLYERAASQVPSLFDCPVENVLGQVPHIPCYLQG